MPSEEAVDEHYDVVITCYVHSATHSGITLTVTGRNGEILKSISQRTWTLVRTITMTRAFHEAEIQCQTDSGLVSNSVSFSVKCLYLLPLPSAEVM